MSRYIVFFISIGRFSTGLFYVFNILMFRAKGKTVLIQPKKGSADYLKLARQATNRRLLITTLLAGVLAAAIVVQAVDINHHYDGAIGTLIAGSLCTLFVCVFVAYTLIQGLGLRKLKNNKPKKILGSSLNSTQTKETD